MRGVKTGRLQNCWVCAWPRVSRHECVCAHASRLLFGLGLGFRVGFWAN